MKKNADTMREKAVRMLDLPVDALCDAATVTIRGAGEVVIENYKSVVDYSDSSVRVVCAEGMVCVAGVNLQLDAITDESVAVSGKISGVEFE